MRNPFLLVVAFVLVAGLALYMTSYTVRFSETAVVATFGSVNAERGVINAEGEEEGLRFRWPAPIQSVTVYDRRPRPLETAPETTQTADNRQVLVTTFLAWRVSDPLLFYRQFNRGGSDVESHYARAEEAIRPLLRSAITEVSKFRLDELFTSAEGGSQIAQLQERILARLRSSEDEAGGGRISDYGIEIETLGISRIVFPQETTAQVFEAMRAERQRIAQAARSEGDAVGAAIEQRARSSADSIREFAEFVSERIRSQGDAEATRWIAQLRENPELAAFLQEMEFMRQAFGRRTTLILPTSGALELFDPRELGERVERMIESDAPSASPAGGGER